MRSLALIGSAALLAACSGTIDNGSSSHNAADITGGFAATSKAFDAVGAIVEVLNLDAAAGPAVDTKCSGTLIGPHTVLTASHCIEKYAPRDSFQYTEHFFYTGADSSNPTHKVRIVGKAVSPELSGGLVGLGSDVAAFQLSDDITDIAPLSIGAALGAADVGKTYLEIGYGLQAVNGAVAALRVRAFGPAQLVAVTGNPLQILFGTIQNLVTYIQAFAPTATVAALTPLWTSPANVLVPGQVFVSSVNDHGAQASSGDSGGPLLAAKVGGGFEIVGVLSGGFLSSSSNGTRAWGGSYYGMPNDDANTTFLAAQLADPTRDVPNAGYCNATTAIRSTVPLENADPIHMVECADFGMVCGTDDTGATCVEPVTEGPASTCELVGGSFVHPRGAVFTFGADGVLDVRGAPFSNYTFVDGILTMNDMVSYCVGTPGTYAIAFAADCNSFTMQLVDDACEVRAEGDGDYVYTRST